MVNGRCIYAGDNAGTDHSQTKFFKIRSTVFLSGHGIGRGGEGGGEHSVMCQHHEIQSVSDGEETFPQLGDYSVLNPL